MSISTSIKFILFLALISFSPFINQINAQAEKEQLKTRASLSSIQENEGMIQLKMLMRAKIDNRYKGLAGLDVSFFAESDSSRISLGNAITNEKGIATLSVSAETIPTDTSGQMSFVAEFDGNDAYKSSDDDIEILPARIIIESITEDSVRYLRFNLTSKDMAIDDEDLLVFVKSLFSRLEVGEETTDENGLAQIEFPVDLPGNVEGNLDFIIQLDDHNDFGTVESNITLPSAMPLSVARGESHRTLWSPDPPLWMILTFVLLMSAVWGHYGVIVYKLFVVKNADTTA